MEKVTKIERLDMGVMRKMPDLLNMSLYEGIDLSNYSLDKIFHILEYHINYANSHSISSVDCYCVKCKRDTTFNSKDTNSNRPKNLFISKKSCSEGGEDVTVLEHQKTLLMM